MTPQRIVRVIAVVAVLALAVTGCSLTLPTDPDRTLAEVSGGTMRVGISPNPGWTTLDDDEPSGVDVELVTEFARGLDSDIDWEPGGEEALIDKLERGELDLVIGGLTDATPWVDKAAITKPFVEVIGEDGSAEKHVMAAPLGENDFLLELETFLLNHEVEGP